MKFALAALPLTMLAGLAGCGAPDGQQGLTAREERELDEAAARQDAAQQDYEAAVREAQAEQAGEQ